ncbi:hypothetical protein NESM_000461500 [Novymonas esmeraldas]|uniref:Uncharacterized protein n=1 Tax=Novymonas esmeraldas TaxID=1808958 RepID=A0AAW0EQY9_9TRYP
MESRYVYDDVTVTATPLHRISVSIDGDDWRRSDGNQARSADEFHIVESNNNVLSSSNDAFPLLADLDTPLSSSVRGTPQRALSPLASPEEPHIKGGRGSERRAGGPRYTSSSWRRGSVDSAKSVSTVAGSRRLNGGGVAAEPPAGAYAGICESVSSFAKVHTGYSSSSSVSGAGGGTSSGKLPALSRSDTAGRRSSGSGISIDTVLDTSLSLSRTTMTGRDAESPAAVVSKRRAPLSRATVTLVPLLPSPSAGSTRRDQRTSDSAAAPSKPSRRVLIDDRLPDHRSASTKDSSTAAAAVPRTAEALLTDYSLCFESAPDVDDSPTASPPWSSPPPPPRRRRREDMTDRGGAGVIPLLTDAEEDNAGNKKTPSRTRVIVNGAWVGGQQGGAVSLSKGRQPSSSATPSTSPVVSRVVSDGELRVRSGSRTSNRSHSGGGSADPRRAASEPSPSPISDGQYFSIDFTSMLSPRTRLPSSNKAADAADTVRAGKDGVSVTTHDSQHLTPPLSYDLSFLTDAAEEAAADVFTAIGKRDERSAAGAAGEARKGSPQQQQQRQRAQDSSPQATASRAAAAVASAPLTLARPVGVPPRAACTTTTPPKSRVRPSSYALAAPVPMRTSATSDDRQPFRFDGGASAGGSRTDDDTPSDLSLSTTLKPFSVGEAESSLRVAQGTHTRMPRPPSRHTERNQYVLGTVIAVEAQCCADDSTASPVPARRSYRPPSARSQRTGGDTRPPKAAAGDNTTPPKSTPAKPPTLPTSPLAVSPSPIVSENTSVHSTDGDTVRHAAHKALHQLQSHVSFGVGAAEVSDSPTIAKAPWPLQRPPRSIVVMQRLFDPEHPHPRGPRTRSLLNGERQANWTAPETHYVTTLADLAAYDDEEDDEHYHQDDELSQQEQHAVNDYHWDEEDVVVSFSASPPECAEEEEDGSDSARGVAKGAAQAAGALTAVTSPPPPIPLSFSPRKPASIVVGAASRAPGSPRFVSFAPSATTLSADAPSSAAGDSLNTSTTISRRSGGIVVDEVEKVHRLREDPEFTLVLGDLYHDGSPQRSQRGGAAATASPPSSVKSSLAAASTGMHHTLSPATGRGSLSSTVRTSSGVSSTTSARGGGGTGSSGTVHLSTLSESHRPSSASVTGDESVCGDSIVRRQLSRGQVLPTFARIIGHLVGDAPPAAGESSRKDGERRRGTGGCGVADERQSSITFTEPDARHARRR